MPESGAGSRSDLARQAAAALDAWPALLPLIPELFADLDALGSDPERLVGLIGDLDLRPRARILDLGCGKGAVSLALARALDVRVEGIDALLAFVLAARQRARELGLEAQVRFRHGDLAAALREPGAVDLVLMAGVGPALGPADATVGCLRRKVRPGGYMVIDDAYLADDAVAAALPGYEDYHGHRETRRRLQAHGDAIVEESSLAADRAERLNRDILAAIRRRARALAERRPELRAVLDAYLVIQEQQIAVEAAGQVFNVTWVLRRCG